MAEARSLADIKLDNAYKFGAGRYLQEAGALNLVGNEVARFGKKALVIAGPRAWLPPKARWKRACEMPMWHLSSPSYPIRTLRAREGARPAGFD